MAHTYRYPVGYGIFFGINYEEAMDEALAGQPLTRTQIARFRKNNPGLLEEVLAQNEYNFAEGTKRGKERREHLRACFGVDGVTKAVVRYKLGGYMVISITVDHDLTEEELAVLDDAVEGQMTDGYFENPAAVFTGVTLNGWGRGCYILW